MNGYRVYGWIRTLCAVAAASLLGIVGSARAQTTTLDTLVAGGTLRCGDLEFSAFNYMAVGPNMPTAGQITVTCIMVGNSPGLLFTSLWLDGTNEGALQTARIDYVATALNGLGIVGAQLLSDPAVIGVPGQSDGFATVSESLLIVPVGNVPTLQAFTSVDGFMVAAQAGDALGFSPRQQIPVVTNLTLSNDDGVPQVTRIAQTFTLVPEPGTAALFGTALLSLPLFLRRRPPAGTAASRRAPGSLPPPPHRGKAA